MEPCGRKRILILRKKDAGMFLEMPDMRTCMVSHIPPECKLAGFTGMEIFLVLITREVNLISIQETWI